jgi:hypothetical protein
LKVGIQSKDSRLGEINVYATWREAKGGGAQAIVVDDKEPGDRSYRHQRGITPLEVMLEAMHGYARSEQWDRAASIAKDAAPYLHPKLTSVERTERDVPIIAADCRC